MNKFQEKTIHTEHIYQGKVIQVQVDEVILPNGEYSKRELVNHPGAVAVIAITKDNKIVFVEQYRKPLERRSEEHTSELQSRGHLVCRLLLEKKNNTEER